MYDYFSSKNNIIAIIIGIGFMSVNKFLFICLFADQARNVGHTVQICKISIWVWKLLWCRRVFVLLSCACELYILNIPHFISSFFKILYIQLCQYGVLSSQWYFVSAQVPGNDDRNTLNALWGKLGSEILMQNWETALEDLNRLKDVIESNVSFVSSCHNVASFT